LAETVYVARPSELAALQAHYASAKAGKARHVVLEGLLGSGKRVLVSEMLRLLPKDEDVLAVRVGLTEDMDGDAAMKALYAGLCGALYRDAVLRGKVELALLGQLPLYGKRQQSWFQVFIDGVKKNVPEPGADKMQLAVPSDNPLAAFAEIVAAVARKIPTVLELQNVHVVQSLGLFTPIDALCELRKEGKLLLILGTESVDDAARAWMPAPWLELLERRKDQLQRFVMEPWSGDDVAAYAASRDIALASPARVAELVQGRPGFIGELIDHLAATGRLADGLEGDLLSLVPTTLDADELSDPPETAKEGRKYATAEDADRIFHLAALLGVQFPSGLVADMAGFDRDSVDDIMDAASDLVKEDQFHKGFDTWLYQFQKPLFREAVILAHQSDADKEIARRVGLFMERVLAPRGYLFVVKTARLYAEYGVGQRANQLRSLALGQENPAIWGMVHDLVKHFSEVGWSDPLRRTVYLNLVERMVGSGAVEAAEGLVSEALEWANGKEDRTLQAWLLFAGSRLDFRRGDMYRSRDRARDAARLYAAGDEKLKLAEIENHLASIELQEGNANASLDHIKRALEHANEPPIQATAEFIRGMLARRAGRHAEAAEHFKKANETAGQLNMAPLALEAGFHYGESLLLSQHPSNAADVLARVAQLANQMQNPVRERSAAALLAQAQGQLRNFEAALQFANRTLQLTQSLKFDKFLPVDIYNVAYYNLALGRNTEAASLFGKARERSGGMDPRFLKDLTFNSGVAFAKIGERASAENAFGEALGHAKASKDLKRFVEASESLAGLVAQRDKPAAARLLNDALAAADQGGLKEERKGLRRKLEELGS
jgi:tetratricopeptide (TPR) repeat protein